MPDSRFFDAHGPMPLRELAALCGVELGGAGAETPVTGVAPLALAGPGDVTFFSDRRYAADLKGTRAAACFLRAADAELAPAGCVPMVAGAPQAAWARAAAALYRVRRHLGEDGAIHPDARLEAGVLLGFGVVIGAGAAVGAGTAIGPGAVIGPGVQIGRDCEIGAHAVISCALLGDRVKILAGAKIGEPGFGVAVDRGGAVDVPQLGRVILQDGVTVGANSCIDRGAFEDTVVGENTKIDNLVQVAHNVRLGRNCLLAAHTGISGSVTAEDGVAFGGRAGIADHIHIGAGAQVAAASGVMKDIPAGEMWMGSPARPIRKFMRETAWLSRMAHRRPGEDKTGGGES